MKASANCRICSSNASAHFTAGDSRYLACKTCGCIQKEMSREDYLNMKPGYDPGSYLNNLSIDKIRTFLEVSDKRATLEQLVQKWGGDPKGARLLDVGCGMGGYLLAGQDLGLDVLGYEPSSNHAALAKSVLQLPVVPDYFTLDSLGGERFDLIVLSHVIEHIYEPHAFVAELVAALKPGGALLMITPNAGSAMARSMGKHWPMLVPIDHVTMFAKDSFHHVTPAGCELTVESAEYPYEFLATWGSVVKSMVKGRPVNTPDMADPEAPQVVRAIDWRGKMLRSAMSIGSLPFYAMARASNNAACLYATVRKPA